METDVDDPLPLEVYGFGSAETEAERAAARRYEVAVAEAIAECMRRQGFEYVVAPPAPSAVDDPVTAGESLVRQEAWVAQYGYGIATRFPAASLDAEQLRAFLEGGEDPDPTALMLQVMSAEERAAWNAAVDTCEADALSSTPPPSDLPAGTADPALFEAINEMNDRIVHDPRYRSADDRWRRCMQERGWEFRDHREAQEAVVDRLWHVLELLVTDDPTAEDELGSVQSFERSLAGDDFACYRGEVLPVQRAVEREYQERFIQQHGDLLPPLDP